MKWNAVLTVAAALLLSPAALLQLYSILMGLQLYKRSMYTTPSTTTLTTTRVPNQACKSIYIVFTNIFVLYVYGTQCWTRCYVIAKNVICRHFLLKYAIIKATWGMIFRIWWRNRSKKRGRSFLNFKKKIWAAGYVHTRLYLCLPVYLFVSLSVALSVCLFAFFMSQIRTPAGDTHGRLSFRLLRRTASKGR